MRQLAEVDVINNLVIIYFYYNKNKYCLIVKTIPFIVVTIAIVIMGIVTQYGAAPYSMIQVIKIQYGAAEQCSMAQQI